MILISLSPFLSSDKVIIKPFYYYDDGKTFIFGSEIKSFLDHPNFVKEVNKKALKPFLTFQYYVLDEMSYEGKNYLMGLQVDNEKEGITNNYIIVESKKDINGNVTLVDIDNIQVLETIGNLFTERLN